MTHWIEPFLVWLKEYFLFQKWQKYLTQRINWSFFFWNIKELNLFFSFTTQTNLTLFSTWFTTQKNWTFVWFMTQRIEHFWMWLKRIELFSNMTQRFEPFFECDSKNWTFFLINMTQRFDLFFEYDPKEFFYNDSKNWILWNDSKNWTIFLRLKELNTFFPPCDSKNFNLYFKICLRFFC